MIVGTCKVRLYLPGNRSLKGKRHIVKSLLDRTKAHLNVSIAEIEEQDKWQVATLGIACVSNSTKIANQIISKAVDLIAKSKHGSQLIDYEVRIL